MPHAGPRVALRALAVVLLVCGLAGCSSDQPVPDARVITYTEARTRYLDGTCALRAEVRFWRPITWSGTARAAGVADAVLPDADRALQRLTGNRSPYPTLVAAPVADLVRTIDRNRAYFEAARAASSAAELQRVAAPKAVPSADTDAIERIVFVSSAPGSDNCPGHGMPAPSSGAGSSTPAASAAG